MSTTHKVSRREHETQLELLLLLTETEPAGTPECALEICSAIVSEGTSPSGTVPLTRKRHLPRLVAQALSTFERTLPPCWGQLQGNYQAEEAGLCREEELPEEKTQVARGKCALGVTGEGPGALLRRGLTT